MLTLNISQYSSEKRMAPFFVINKLRMARVGATIKAEYSQRGAVNFLSSFGLLSEKSIKQREGL